MVRSCRVKQNLHYSTLSPVGKNQQDCLWFSSLSAQCAFVLQVESLQLAGNSNSIGTLREEKDERRMKNTIHMRKNFVVKLDNWELS